MTRPQIRVEGLRELRSALAKADPIDGRVQLRDALKDAAGVVADEAKRRIPSRTGRARDSVRAVSAGNRAFVKGGKARVSYYGWLDFGSRRPATGNPRSVGPWTGTGAGPTGGRFIYPAIDAKERQVVDLIEHAVSRALDALDL